ncbi:MAG: hypothetical protein WAU48_01055 [Gammaproteobacteria bacterium]
MLSGLFLSYALIHLLIWLWGWRLWSQTGRPRVLLIVLIASTLLFYDNFRIGIGRFLGQGELLYALSVPAFAWHWSLLPLLIIAAGALARLAGLRWAQSRLVMGAFCVVAVLLSALDIPSIFSMQLYPACLADTLRYSTRVSVTQLCPGSDLVISSGPGPLVAILTNVVVLAVGIALWIQRGWPWLTVGAGLMFIAAGAFASSEWSLPIANLGEICFTLAYIISCAHFARHRLEQRL